MADSNCCEYFLDRTSSSANIASNRLGPWENASVKSLCIDWKFFEFCELNNSLKNQQDADICLKLKQENDRKTAARLRLEEREKKTNEEQSNKVKNVPTEELSKPIAGKKQLFIKSKSKSFVSSRVSTAQFYEGDSTSSSSINRRSNLHSANDVDLLNRIASASASASHSNKQPPPSNGSLFRTKSSFSIDDIKNLELIEKQIDKHLRELELKKTTKTATTCDSDNDSTTSLNEKETTSSDSSPSHIALYRIKKLEEMQRNVNQSRKRSSKSSSNTRTAFNRVACNQTPFDVKFFISTMTNEDRSSQSPPIINNDANNNRSKVAAEDNLNIKSRPLKSVSNVNITFDEKPPVEATMTTLAEQLTEIDNIRMQITNEFNQIISIAPLTRVKSVVFRHEEIENNKPRSPSIVVPTSTNNYHETTTVLQRPKSTINQRKTSKSVLSFGNSLPSSAVSNSRAGFAAKRLVSTKIGDFEESIEILNDADNKPMPQLQVRSESASSINTKAYPLFKTNVRPARQNSGNKKVFDLIRVDGKRYSTPENNYEINSRIFPRNNKDTFLVENKRTQVNSPDKKSSQFKLKEFSKIKSLIKPAYF